jgi:peroxiredoxin
VIGVVAAMLLASRSPGSSGGAGGEAPPFTLASTAGRPVSLADNRQDVLLYFSAGAGCDSCFYQMAELEDNAATLSASGLSVVPIVVNPVEQVLAEMNRFGLSTPFLIDSDRSVSDAYGVGRHRHACGSPRALVRPGGRLRPNRMAR